MHCRKLVIKSEELADIILVARSTGIGSYTHACHFAELAPRFLEPSQDELNALASNGVGQLHGKAIKAVTKIDQIFKDRKLIAVHLFYSSSHKNWHMFYFNQRDYSTTNNHWEHGPHIHYSQNSFVRESLVDIWRKVCQPNPVFPKSVHVRYDSHHNRRRN